VPEDRVAEDEALGAQDVGAVGIGPIRCRAEPAVAGEKRVAELQVVEVVLSARAFRREMDARDMRDCLVDVPNDAISIWAENEIYPWTPVWVLYRSDSERRQNVVKCV
jgi:hypothetical protein